MSRLTRDGTAEPISRDQILRHARGQGTNHFPCSADHEQDWQPYPVDPYSTICDDYTYILCMLRSSLSYSISYKYIVRRSRVRTLSLKNNFEHEIVQVLYLQYVAPFIPIHKRG